MHFIPLMTRKQSKWKVYRYRCWGGGGEGVASFFEDIPLVEFMYLVFTRMPGASYRRGLRSLLLCFGSLINPTVC